MKPPAFQFYADDFLAGTMDLSAEEVGAYIRLLCHQWNRGGLTADSARLNRLAGCEVPAEVLEKFEQCEDGLFRNPRLEDERQKQEDYRAKQSAHGRRGGRPKKGSEKGSLSQPFQNPLENEKGLKSSPSPSPSPSPIIEERENRDANIPTVNEVIAFGDRSGIGPDVCRKFFEHYEGNNLWQNQHGRLIKWQVKLPGWAARERAGTGADKGTSANAPQSAPSASMVMMRDMEALKRAEARRKEIRDGYEYHMGVNEWRESDRVEFRKLGEELKTLKQRLDLAA